MVSIFEAHALALVDVAFVWVVVVKEVLHLARHVPPQGVGRHIAGVILGGLG